MLASIVNAVAVFVINTLLPASKPFIAWNVSAPTVRCPAYTSNVLVPVVPTFV
jgi:hypothetical protein